MSEAQEIKLSIEQVDAYEFRVHFDDSALPDLRTDEPPPLGGGVGPNPGRLLVAAVGNCLMASLLFALRKFRNDPAPLRAHAQARLARNAAGRWRIAGMEVDLQLADAAAALQHVERALAQFEDFCIVTESVRTGIPVAVRVHDAAGVEVHASTTPG